MTLYINHIPYEWAKARIKYADVLALAEEQPGAQIAYQIRMGKYVEHGFIIPGSSVRAWDGMRITVGAHNQLVTK